VRAPRRVELPYPAARPAAPPEPSGEPRVFDLEEIPPAAPDPDATRTMRREDIARSRDPEDAA
jgi:hypothetical protein